MNKRESGHLYFGPTSEPRCFAYPPADASSASIEANHLHIDTSYIERDLNVALPLDRLRELVEAGAVGAMAEHHYSIMGYQGNDTTALVIEAAGIPTVTLNMIWVYQNVVGMPRVAAIEHPFGRPYGDVGDAETQRAVLRAALGVFLSADEPGCVEHLPFRWHQEPADTKWHPAEPSPIIAMIKKARAAKVEG